MCTFIFHSELFKKKKEISACFEKCLTSTPISSFVSRTSACSIVSCASTFPPTPFHFPSPNPLFFNAKHISETAPPCRFVRKTSVAFLRAAMCPILLPESSGSQVLRIGEIWHPEALFVRCGEGRF